MLPTAGNPVAESTETSVPAVPQGIAPPPPPPPPPGPAIIFTTKGTAARAVLETTNPITSMKQVREHKTAIDGLIEKELQLILSMNPANMEASQKKLASIRDEIARKQWPLSNLGKKYSLASTDLKEFLGSLEAASIAKLMNPHEPFETKKSILKPGLEALTPVVDEIETLFAGRAINLQTESDWIKAYESLKGNLSETETDIQRVHTLIPKLNEAATNPSHIPSLTLLAGNEHAKALTEIESLEAKKRGIQDKISETIRSFRLGQAYFALVEIGLYAPISDSLKTLNSVEKKTQRPAEEKQKTKPEVTPHERALIDFINRGLENGTTSAGPPLADGELMQRIQDRMCEKIGVRFLLLQKEYPDCFKTDWSFDHVNIGKIFAEKLLGYCVSMREEVDHKDMLKFAIASRSGSAFPPNGAPFRQTVECSIQMDLETGLNLTKEDLARFYSNQDLDSDLSDSNEGMDIDIDSFDPDAPVDVGILDLLKPEEETAANETCSEGSEIEDFVKKQPKP